MGFNVSPHRLIEPGKREGRQELITPRALKSCHGNGGLEGLFDRCWLKGIALKQKLTAQTMKLRVGKMLARLVRNCQSPVDRFHRVFGSKLGCLQLGK
jgi:hypothetical protein